MAVFPECVLTGYCYESRDEALPFAEPAPGPSTDALAADCRELGVWAVVGMLERAGADLFNACALVGPDGFVSTYRKIHLPYLGVDRFTTPGDRPFAVHDLGGLRVGMNICYDGSFPESGRVLAVLGADLLVLPTNWPTGAAPTIRHLTAARAWRTTSTTPPSTASARSAASASSARAASSTATASCWPPPARTGRKSSRRRSTPPSPAPSGSSRFLGNTNWIGSGTAGRRCIDRCANRYGRRPIRRHHRQHEVVVAGAAGHHEQVEQFMRPTTPGQRSGQPTRLIAAPALYRRPPNQSGHSSRCESRLANSK